MEQRLNLTIVTPKGEFLNKDNIVSIAFSTIEGEVEVFPKHTPVVASVVPSLLKYREEGKDISSLVVGKGYVEVTQNRVLLVVEDVTDGTEFDKEKLIDELKKVREELEKGKYNVDSITFTNLYYRELWLLSILKLKEES